MNSKEQKIKEAYGEHWEELRICIDSNGWIVIHKSETQFKNFRNIFDLDIKYNSEQELKFIRPKSLQGIENNNGWIKIESEDEITQQGEYDMSSFKLICWTNKGLLCSDSEEEITHYQLIPIVKTLPPLY